MGIIIYHNNVTNRFKFLTTLNLGQHEGLLICYFMSWIATINGSIKIDCILHQIHDYRSYVNSTQYYSDLFYKVEPYMYALCIIMAPKIKSRLIKIY